MGNVQVKRPATVVTADKDKNPEINEPPSRFGYRINSEIDESDMFTGKKVEELTHKVYLYQNEIKAKDDLLQQKNEEIDKLKAEIDKLHAVIELKYQRPKNVLEPLMEDGVIPGEVVKTKRQGLSGETLDINPDTPLTKCKKDARSEQLIKEAIMANDFLKKLDWSQTKEIIECMYQKTYKKDELIIQEGTQGQHLYVAAEGLLEVYRNGKYIRKITTGQAFGELAILYNCTRTASVKATQDARVWALDRTAFKVIMMNQGIKWQDEKLRLLNSVPLLQNLPHDILAKLADFMEIEFFREDHHIIRQGTFGDTFYIITKGEVKVVQNTNNTGKQSEIRHLYRGDFFGELALLSEERRTATVIALTPGVECLTLDRSDFDQYFGDLKNILESVKSTYGNGLDKSFKNQKGSSESLTRSPEYDHVQFSDLKFISVLGVGGFGRVDLVQMKNDKSKSFALKRLKKKVIVDTKQQAHVHSEKKIMLTVNSPFIVKLYRTFRDVKFVYMLMEVCLGGELWTVLREVGHFDDAAARFFIGCVLEALAYLHQKRIVFRDLKPENLLMCENGYIKLVDFGFAKTLSKGTKTWTFCGTPEYVAPEVILMKGHSFTVDYWAVGILTYELLTGSPPFMDADPLKIYNRILDGIQLVDFPRKIGRNAQNLIKKLCHNNASERLGYGSGVATIKKHRWFQGFDWEGLQDQKLKPPMKPLRPVKSNIDTINFDKFTINEKDETPDETSGWDEDF